MDMKPKLIWNAINWRRIQKVTTKLQRKIYNASKQGNLQKLRVYQTTLMNSPSAKLLAVRKVTQDNRGRKTAGVDGVRQLQPPHRLKLAQTLRLDGRSDPIRRVYIPKPGTDERRPLGIPTIRDRAKQALAKMILEPEWEARFELNSYGFRPGRSCHDAIDAIWHALRASQTGKFVLDADISKCFDTINHDALLAKMNTWPIMRKQVRAWLKTGVLDKGHLITSTAGTPQGGVVSPLLSNIALHGLENHLKQWVEKQIITDARGNKLSAPKKRAGLACIRYADDFVILHKDLNIVELAKSETQLWLKSVGLTLKEAKTLLTHTDMVLQGQVGFDFLGFSVRRYAVGPNSRNKWGAKYRTYIKPAKQSVKNHLADVDAVLKGTTKTKTVLTKLNPIIRGWCNYFSTVTSKLTFGKLRQILFYKLWRWVRRKHPSRSLKWLYKTYFNKGANGQVVFGAFNQSNWVGLMYHNTYAIKRHVKVRGEKSPYDGDHTYWSQRLKNHSIVLDLCQKTLRF